MGFAYWVCFKGIVKSPEGPGGLWVLTGLEPKAWDRYKRKEKEGGVDEWGCPECFYYRLVAVLIKLGTVPVACCGRLLQVLFYLRSLWVQPPLSRAQHATWLKVWVWFLAYLKLSREVMVTSGRASGSLLSLSVFPESSLNVEIQNLQGSKWNKEQCPSWSGKTLKNTFLLPHAWRAHTETTSGQRSAYAEHGVPLLDHLSLLMSFVITKPQFQGQTKNGKDFGLDLLEARANGNCF